MTAILFILKLFACILFILLLLFLTVLMLVLFVPVRYEARFRKEEVVKAGLRISWMFRLISWTARYEESGYSRAFRLFGFPIGKRRRKMNEEKKARMQEAASREDIAEPDSLQKKEENEHASLREGSMPETKIETSSEQPVSFDRSGTKRHDKKKRRSFSDSFRSLRENLCALTEKKERLEQFWQNEKNRETIRLLWNQVMALLCHLKPRKLEGSIRFGFENPYTTGQILMYISPFYGLYARTVDVIPVFDEEVLEGRLFIKGRVRAATVLWLACKVFRDKNLRRLWKKRKS